MYAFLVDILTSFPKYREVVNLSSIYNIRLKLLGMINCHECHLMDDFYYFRIFVRRIFENRNSLKMYHHQPVTKIHHNLV